ncbi:hypothetical protein ABIE13_000747, partial [Ottowia thiooxydans]
KNEAPTLTCFAWNAAPRGGVFQLGSGPSLKNGENTRHAD